MNNSHADDLTLLSDGDAAVFLQDKAAVASKWSQWARLENKYTYQHGFFTGATQVTAIMCLATIIRLFHSNRGENWALLFFFLALTLGCLGWKRTSRRRLTVAESNMRKILAIVPDIEGQLFCPPMSEQENLTFTAQRGLQ